MAMVRYLKSALLSGLFIWCALGIQSCTKTDANNINGNNSGGSGSAATVNAPSTFFLAAQDYSTSGIGAYEVQQFTIGASTNFAFRFASQYQAQAAIITPDQLSKFEANQSFTGFSIFDKTFGTNNFSLSAGTYYLAIRNAVSGANKWSVELDFATTLPASDKATFVDNYVSGAKSFNSAGKFWQPFTIQSGYRYFLDGCNVNCDFKIIPASDLAAYQNGQTYKYFTDYVDGTGAAPGLWELTLPAGDYDLVSTNTVAAALTYTLERWRVK